MNIYLNTAWSIASQLEEPSHHRIPCLVGEYGLRGAYMLLTRSSLQMMFSYQFYPSQANSYSVPRSYRIVTLEAIICYSRGNHLLF